MCVWFYSACRFDEKESNIGLDGSLVQHGGEYEFKGVLAMLERLYELPEGKKLWVHHRWKFMSILMYFMTDQNYEVLGFAAVTEVSIFVISCITG